MPRLLRLFSNLCRPQVVPKLTSCLNSKSFSILSKNNLVSLGGGSLTVSRSELTSSQSRLVNCINGVYGANNGSNTGLCRHSFGAVKFGVRFDSTKRKRKKMMNKHKYEKRMKTLKSLSSLNIRGGKSRVG